jgi:hypothetical protein
MTEHTIYVRLTVQHVDGPRHTPAAVAEAVTNMIAGDTLEMLTHEAFPVRSRYIVDDAESVTVEEVPA